MQACGGLRHAESVVGARVCAHTPHTPACPDIRTSRCTAVHCTCQADTTYFIVVDGYSGAAGKFTLTVTCTKCPSAEESSPNSTAMARAAAPSSALLQALLHLSLPPAPQVATAGTSGTAPSSLPAVLAAPGVQPLSGTNAARAATRGGQPGTGADGGAPRGRLLFQEPGSAEQDEYDADAGSDGGDAGEVVGAPPAAERQGSAEMCTKSHSNA
jgi:hypothetical protein